MTAKLLKTSTSSLLLALICLSLSACTQMMERPSINVSGNFYWNDVVTLHYALPLQGLDLPDIRLNGELLPKTAIFASDKSSITFPLALLSKPQPEFLSIELSSKGEPVKLKVANVISPRLVYQPKGIAKLGRMNVLMRCTALQDSVTNPEMPGAPDPTPVIEGFSVLDYFGNAGSLYHPGLGSSLHPDPWCLMVLGFAAESTEQALKSIRVRFAKAGISILAISPDYYVYGNDPGGHSFDTDCSQQGRLALEAAKSKQIPESELRLILGAAESSLTGKGVTIALIDGGVAEPERFLGSSLASDFSRRFTVSEYLIPDADAQNIQDDFDCSNTPFFDGHGSLVSRIVSQIAPEANLMALKACDAEGLCSTSSIVKALLYLRNDYEGFPGVDIVNMSFGGPIEANPVFESLLKDFMASQDILFVTSSGNNPEQKSHYPAQYQTMFANVVATTALRQSSLGSNWQLASFNTKMLLFPNAKGAPFGAPGVAIKLNDLGSPSGVTGTSFAAPVLTGLAALALEQNPDYRGYLLLKRLELAAKPLQGARLIQLP